MFARLYFRLLGIAVCLVLGVLSFGIAAGACFAADSAKWPQHVAVFVGAFLVGVAFLAGIVHLATED